VFLKDLPCCPNPEWLGARAAFAYATAALSPTMDIANAVLLTLPTALLFAAGYLLRWRDIPRYWIWFGYINWRAQPSDRYLMAHGRTRMPDQAADPAAAAPCTGRRAECLSAPTARPRASAHLLIALQEPVRHNGAAGHARRARRPA